MNKKFSEKVMEVYDDGFMTWVHDYHLLLLPSYILRRHRSAHIGLFLHSPFPASDIFRTLAKRDELLRAMLNADLIGFLLFEYTRNFLTCCKRMREYTDFARVAIPPRTARAPLRSHPPAPSHHPSERALRSTPPAPAPPPRPRPHRAPTSSVRRAAASSAYATASAPSSCRCRTSASSPTPPQR